MTAYNIIISCAITLTLFAKFNEVTGQEEYPDLCDKNICHRYKHGRYYYAHNIGCNNDGKYSSRCSKGAALQTMTAEMKHYILSLHNDHRNTVAQGNLDGYDSANRMATMVWNDELAYLASLNCLRCYYGPDACRNTQIFPHVGQNIDLYWSSKGYLTNEDEMKRVFNTWFNEYRQANMRVIKSYYSTGKMIGHFTQIVSDKSKFVGCALIHYTEPHDDHLRYNMYFVCNYSFTNYIGEPVYTVGETASQCTSGTDSIYNALCGKEEYYDENALPGDESNTEPSHAEPNLSESSTTTTNGLPGQQSETTSDDNETSTNSMAKRSSSSSGSQSIESHSNSYYSPSSTLTSTSTSTPTSTPTSRYNEHSRSRYSRSRLSSYVSYRGSIHPSMASSATIWSASSSQPKPTKTFSSMSYDSVTSYTTLIPNIPLINASIPNVPAINQ